MKRYDPNTIYKTRKEARAALDAARPIKPGDKIGFTTVKSVYYSDNFLEYNNEKEGYELYFMCEYKDTNGNYRNFKSIYDKQTVILM